MRQYYKICYKGSSECKLNSINVYAISEDDAIEQFKSCSNYEIKSVISQDEIKEGFEIAERLLNALTKDN